MTSSVGEVFKGIEMTDSVHLTPLLIIYWQLYNTVATKGNKVGYISVINR